MVGNKYTLLLFHISKSLQWLEEEVSILIKEIILSFDEGKSRLSLCHILLGYIGLGEGPVL